MADLRTRFIEDYAGGLLNVSRQELSTTGEVLSQDGFTSEGTVFVEDGSGVKSGLKLGVSLAEVVDPTTDAGAVNVRFADRTYAKIRDLRIFTTAVASTQAALSEAVSTSVSNVETSLQLLEDGLNTLDQNVQTNLTASAQRLQDLSATQKTLLSDVATQSIEIGRLDSRVFTLENPTQTELEIDPIAITTNEVYYAGTIQIAAGAVTGTGTAFDQVFTIGSKFLSATAGGEVVEFTVRSFSTTAPGTSMNVTPTNKTIPSGALYQRNQILVLQNKINEIISAMKSLNLLV